MRSHSHYGVGTLIFAAAAMFAVLRPAIAQTVSPGHEGANSRFELSIMESTQGNFGGLGIGVGYVGGGPYLDENGVRQDGLHAGLAISVQDKPSAFQQPEVHEGQTLEVAGIAFSSKKSFPKVAAPSSCGFRGRHIKRIMIVRPGSNTE